MFTRRISPSVHVRIFSSSWPMRATATHVVCSSYAPSPRAVSTSKSCVAAVAAVMKRGGSYSSLPVHSARTVGSFTRMSRRHSVCIPCARFAFILS